MTHDELEGYINGFKEHQREAVYKQILDSEILEKAFSTSEGKLILNSAVDMITGNIIKILNICLDNGSEKAGELAQPCATEINTAYKMMTEWAKVLIRGNEHKNKIDKLG